MRWQANAGDKNSTNPRTKYSHRESALPRAAQCDHCNLDLSKSVLRVRRRKFLGFLQVAPAEV